MKMYEGVLIVSVFFIIYFLEPGAALFIYLPLMIGAIFIEEIISRNIEENG